MRIIILLILTICCAYAKSYREVRFEGLMRLSQLSATELIGFGAGEEVSAKRLNDAIKTLYDQSYFTDISAEDQNGVLVFSFVEKPVISGVNFTGMSETERDEKYLPVFGIKRGETYDQRKIDAAKKRLIDLSASEGYYDSLVEVESEIKDNKVYLTVTYAKGSNITITKTNIAGAEALKPKDLQRSLGNRERQSLGFLPGRSDGRLQLLELPNDSARLRDHYMRYGYLDADVSEPLLRADMDTYFATLDYTVVEGVQYSVSSVSIEVIDKENTIKGLIEDLRLQPMNRFDISKMRADINTIREEVAEGGYAFVRVTPDIRKNTDAQTASITYIVE